MAYPEDYDVSSDVTAAESEGPTITTQLKQLRAQNQDLNKRFDNAYKDYAALEGRVTQIEKRLG